MNQDIYVVLEHFKGKIADISYVMLAAAQELAKGTGGKVVAVLLGHQAEGLAQNIKADQVMYGDDPGLAEFTSTAYQTVLAQVIKENEPRAVLFGSTTIGTDVADVLSVRLDLPIVSSVIKTSPDEVLTSKICGGKIFTESGLGDKTTIVTMIPGGYKVEEGKAGAAPEIVSLAVPEIDAQKVSLVEYIEPDQSDVDISLENILVAVGRGIQTEDNLELAEELAELLGGVVCASRPVIDQGWLPVTRMVGKSGRSVKPKLYLALGISGAPEHIEGCTSSDIIIAVNTDPDAPIFKSAKYGVEMDMFDLIDPLLDAIEAAK
jgi:electron transfer flavoprotein alpha subunit